MLGFLSVDTLYHKCDCNCNCNRLLPSSPPESPRICFTTAQSHRCIFKLFVLEDDRPRCIAATIYRILTAEVVCNSSIVLCARQHDVVLNTPVPSSLDSRLGSKIKKKQDPSRITAQNHAHA